MTVKLRGDVTIREAAVDWMTLTAKPNQGDILLQALAGQVLAEEQFNGEKKRPWAWRTYSGWHCGQATWGTGEYGALLQLSGSCAEKWFGASCDTRWHCTRLDLQVTCRIAGDLDVAVEQAYSEATAGTDAIVRNCETRLIKSGRGGYTAYVGTRGSQRFGRIYNKERESGDERHAHCVRWELEARANVASAVRSHLSTVADRRTSILGYVYTYFANRGCRPPWDAGSLLLHCDSPRRNTSADSQLAWLDSKVRPTVEWLTDHGHMADVLAILFGGHPDLWADPPLREDSGDLANAADGYP